MVPSSNERTPDQPSQGLLDDTLDRLFGPEEHAHIDLPMTKSTTAQTFARHVKSISSRFTANESPGADPNPSWRGRLIEVILWMPTVGVVVAVGYLIYYGATIYRSL